ncbi:MAG: prenyltransferase [Myxococcales bacterium]|nr:MAG: prenyltransferase [Myxococcales bacterium]
MTASLTGGGLPDSSVDRWFYALKPASWPKLVVPALFGQLLGASATGQLSLAALGWGFGFTVFGLAFIVLLNDWGDREVDALKRRMFPDGCSPKTIPDGILRSRSVGVAGVACGVVTALLAGGAEVALGRSMAFETGVLCMLVFVAYTLPPVRLNYRGGGELLEMFGVGVALPLYNFYLQAGSIGPVALPWVAGFAVLSLASGVASGLSDEQSDRAGGKRTFASTFGNAAARRLTEASVLAGCGIWVAAAVVRPDWTPVWAALPAIAIVLWNFAAMRRVSAEAVTNAFGAQSAYKHFLHRAIWHSTTVAAVLLWLHSSLA